MSNLTEVTRVNIFGREYTIRGAGSPAYIAEIAHYVDMKMRQMTDNATMASTTKVAIFAALNIADELYQKRDKYEELEESQSSEVTHLADRIEQVLSEVSHSPQLSASEHSDSSAIATAIQQNSTSDIPR
ncbi:MAG: cell division protein ZapA [Candidatus Aegiribacteria sp.]|nr:cell division protein ZapA [Candidatus Aegiribacteria sp.]